MEILIPNSSLLEKSVTNLTLSDRRLRVSVKVGVAYGSPTTRVSEIIGEAVAAHGLILKEPAPVILFEDFGDSALIFSVYLWLDQNAQPDFRSVASDLRHMLARRFADAGIVIAFPQLDVHLNSPGAARPEDSSKTPAAEEQRKME